MAALGLLLVSCVLDDFDPSGLPCPCAQGWTCDVLRNVCELRAPTGTGVFCPMDLVRVWATPNQIRWGWSLAPSAREEDFQDYELWTGANREDVTRRRSPAMRWSREVNAELGLFALVRTGGRDIVLQTTTDSHLPDTDYYALLVAHDRHGSECFVGPALGRTTVDFAVQADVFINALQMGYVLPAGKVTTDGALRYIHDTCANAGEMECWENIQLGGQSVPLNGLGPGAFQSAYLELTVLYDGPQPGYWSAVGMHFGMEGSLPYSYEGWTMRNKIPRTYQFPLEILASEVGPLTSSEAMRGIEGFWVGTGWRVGSTVTVDDVRVKW